MEIRPTPIAGCLEICPPRFQDERGSFVKTYQRDFFLQQNLVTDWQEEYYSISQAGVLRGLHFQTPPHDHEKLVHCAQGKALDVVVDLRLGSPTYGKHHLVELDCASANMLYIPRGLAHGFLALEDETLMMYRVASLHAPSHDAGILWNSCGIAWPPDAPILSERDLRWPAFSDFKTPFVFDPGLETQGD